MNKKLNISLIKRLLDEKGISQTELAENLSLSRQSISLWLKGTTFPRPSELLKLSKLLSLKYSDIVEINNEYEPRVAFRKVGSAKTTETHIKKAKELGYALENLVEFLPNDMLIKPSELKKPINNYGYLQNVSNLIRETYNAKELAIKFDAIINIINSFKIIFIPVMLGDKKNHENAIHIYLPKSETTWIYINLDTKIFDFKFWLSHELGHILSPSLEGKEAEDFADNFAGAFLFPEEIAMDKYNEVIKSKRKSEKIDCIINTANDIVISPITILKEMNKYAKNAKLSEIDLGNTFYAANTNFNKQYALTSEGIFDSKTPSVKEYITASEKYFETIFFKLLRKHNSKNDLNINYMSNMLNIPYIDSIEIFNYIVKQNGTD